MKNNELHPRTLTINHKQRLACIQSRQKALAWLIERFPKAFDTSEEMYPLSIGIMDDILNYAHEAHEQGISKSKLREALVMFTRRLDYLACLKAQGQRINLLGEPSGTVSDEEAQCAALKIKKRVEKTLKSQRKSSPESVTRYGSQAPYYSESQAFVREPAVRKTEIVFKPKLARASDPLSVERLKSKLGLARKEEV